MTVAEVKGSMTLEEIHGWGEYFDLVEKQRKEQERQRKANAPASRRGRRR